MHIFTNTMPSNLILDVGFWHCNSVYYLPVNVYCDAGLSSFVLTSFDSSSPLTNYRRLKEVDISGVVSLG